MIPMIKGERADYSASLFEIKGVSIIYKESGVFVDVLKGIYPDYIAKKSFVFIWVRSLIKVLKLKALWLSFLKLNFIRKD